MAVISSIFLFQLKNSIKYKNIWLLLAFTSILLCSNMTALIMLFCGLFLMIFVFKTTLNKAYLKFLFFLFLPATIPIVFYKIDHITQFYAYYNSMVPAVNMFLENIINLEFKNILFGYGSVGHKFIVENKIETGTDFGILTLINQAGMLLFLVCLVAIFQMNYKGFVFSKQLNFDNVKHKNDFQLTYYQFYIINIIVVDILFISSFITYVQ